MASVALPLFISYNDIQQLSRRTRRVLHDAWNPALDDLESRMDAYNTIVEFLARIDPYEESLLPKLPHSIELFQAHVAQAFRHARMLLLIAVPPFLCSLGHPIDVDDVHVSVDRKSKEVSHTLEIAVELAREHKEERNSLVGAKKYCQAVEAYMLGLAVLLPFSSDNTIMTFEQSGRAGLRQIEESLLTNIMVTANKAATGQKKTARAWMSIFSYAMMCLEHHPHATYGGVVKRVKLQKGSIEEHRACFSHDAIGRFEALKKALEAWKTRDPGAWAHQHCDWTHACCRMETE